MRKQRLSTLLLSLSGLLLSLTAMTPAQAVPSFARQTGASCASCHTAFPQLTAFGRQFKMQGYTMTSTEQVKADGLDIDLLAPLSMMIQTTWSHLKSAPDPQTANTQFRLPAQLSIFYAGRITDHIGSFVQITAEDGGAFSQDNTDVRFANTGNVGGSEVSYGVSLNNSPTVQDPWNSTPTWGFPWFEAGYGYEFPDTLTTALGGSVAGMTAYGFWDNHLYTELGAYEAANMGSAKTVGGNVIKGAAPYWRLAYTADAGNMNWEIGALGMNAEVPTGGYDSGQAVDKLTDAGVDAQLQWTLADNQTLTLDANYTHEKQSLDFEGKGDQHLNTMKADLTWYSHQTWGMTVGYRGSSSSSNAMSGIDNTTLGDQGSSAYLVQLDYTPWLNTRFAVQYVDYTKLHGTSTGASGSNQLMLGAWFLF